MKMGGHVIALPLFMETFAFFLKLYFLVFIFILGKDLRINGFILL